jgi:ornithine cyclodeaminase
MEGARTVRLLRRGETVECLAGADVVGAVREALIASARGEAMAPASLSFDFRRQRGEAHVKGAYIEGSSDWTVKLATGFYDNPRQGLPTASGMSLVSSAGTGIPEAIILDGGHLTDVRTAAAGCLAVDALAPERVERVGVIGCGIQARIQLEYMARRRRLRQVVAFGRDRGRAERYAVEMSEGLGLEVVATGDAREAVAGAQVVVTATPSQEPLVEAAWLAPGATVVAVGADMPGKQELDPEILEQAEILVADDPAQAARIGELQHVTRSLGRARALGDLLANPPGPRNGGVAVVDLTGLGAEDAAIAGLVAERARQLNLGDAIAID